MQGKCSGSARDFHSPFSRSDRGNALKYAWKQSMLATRYMRIGIGNAGSMERTVVPAGAGETL